MLKKPNFFRYWKFYLLGKSIQDSAAGKEIQPAYKGLAAGIGGVFGYILFKVAIDLNEVIYYILVIPAWIFMVSLVAYLVIQPKVVGVEK